VVHNGSVSEWELWTYRPSKFDPVRAQDSNDEPLSHIIIIDGPRITRNLPSAVMGKKGGCDPGRFSPLPPGDLCIKDPCPPSRHPQNMRDDQSYNVLPEGPRLLQASLETDRDPYRVIKSASVL